ncbi:MAG: hypothetical protein ACR2KX_04495 [Chitinophagaceae bacterium]
MKGKIKNVNQLLEDYISLLDEQIEIPLLIEKAKEKYEEHLSEHTTAIYRPKETNELFKIFTQIKKQEEREVEIRAEIQETESLLKDFLTFIKGGKIAYEKKDDTDKSKITFLFWIENDTIMSNR